MAITILDPPKQIAYKDLYPTYREGKGIYYEAIDENGNAVNSKTFGEPVSIRVYAEEEISFPKDSSEYEFSYEWRKKQLEGEFEFLNEKRRLLIEPFPETDMFMAPQCFMAKKDFYSQQMVNVLKTQRKGFRKYYKERCTDMQILYMEDEYFGGIAVYGTSITEGDLEKFQEKISPKLKSISYGDYMRTYYELDKSKKEKTAENNGKALPILEEIRKWIGRVSFTEYEEEITRRVIGQSEVSTVLAGVYAYLRGLANGRPQRSNMIIVAPSGTGKTETYRAIREYFKKEIPGLPVAQTDLSLITAEGFKGNDTKEMLMPLLNHAETNGIGLLFLDEFDKKIEPAYTGRNENVNMQIQSQLLTTIEGSIFTASVGRETKTIDTGNTLYIGLGAFDLIRRQRGDDAAGKISGFGQLERKGKELHYDPITKDDMIKMGGSYELLGRFPLIINYQCLKREAIDRIIDRALADYEKNLQVKLEVSEKFRKLLHASSNGSFGCRQLSSMISEAIMPAYAEFLRNGDENSVIIIDGKGNGRVEGAGDYGCEEG